MTFPTTDRSLARTATLLVLGALGFAGRAHGETAYRNFPEVPSGWYATNCCQGATIADDVQVAAGTEGMRLNEITLRVYESPGPHEMTLQIRAHDEQTGLPGAILGSVPFVPANGNGYSVETIDVWSLGVQIPASGRLWIAIDVQNGWGGWNVAGTVPSTGASGDFYARDGGDGWETTIVDVPEIQHSNLMLVVDAVPEPCAADVTNDLVVDVEDLVALILEWGCTSPPSVCLADVNADGIVDVADLTQLILAWGPCFDQ